VEIVVLVLIAAFYCPGLKSVNDCFTALSPKLQRGKAWRKKVNGHPVLLPWIGSKREHEGKINNPIFIGYH
ncbi:MAG: hypothetical protein ACOCUL_03290, partial [Bacteroidota bacterium]